MENMSASLHTVIRRYALILGVNEIASATAVEMRQRGWTVVLGHDPFPPVIRRKMAFHDVLFGDAVVIDDIGASLAEDAMALLNLIRNGAGVIVTPLQTHDLIALRTPDVLVDARMQKYRTTPDLRHIAPLTIGLGPSFSAGANCDLAVETQPAGSGRLIKRGAPAAADHTPQRLGGVGEERFLYSSRGGLWHTAVEIGSRVFKGFVVGRLDGLPTRAPIDGVVRGLIRDGSRIPADQGAGDRPAWPRRAVDRDGRAIKGDR